MPIKGLTDRGMAFPEIGQIRKGEPKPEDGKRPGKDLEYFRVEFDELEAEAKEKFEAEYGTEPKEILIWLPYAEKERCWDVWLEAYTAGQMIARSDGEFIIFARDYETGEILVKDGKDIDGNQVPYVEGQPAGFYTDGKGNRKPINFEPVGRLQVIIPALKRLASLTVHTQSYYDIANISSNLEALEFINDGDLRNINILMKRKPKEISVPMGNGSRRRMTKWLIFLEAEPEWVENLVNGQRKRAELENVTKLPELPPEIIDSEDFEEAEFTEETATKESHQNPEGERIRFSSRQIELLVKENIVPDYEMAEAILYKSCLDIGEGKDFDEHITRWARNYMANIETGKNPADAVKAANNAYQNFLKRQEK